LVVVKPATPGTEEVETRLLTNKSKYLFRELPITDVADICYLQDLQKFAIC